MLTVAQQKFSLFGIKGFWIAFDSEVFFPDNYKKYLGKCFGIHWFIGAEYESD